MTTLNREALLRNAAGYVTTYWDEIHLSDDRVVALIELFEAPEAELLTARDKLAHAWNNLGDWDEETES